jgi:hypothetical protein
MAYTLTEAAKATSKAKSTIHAAIKKGRITANRNDLGEYVIDPSELHRVFPQNAQLNDKSNKQGRWENTDLLIENATLKAKLEVMGELTRQIEGERDNLREQTAAWQAQAEALKLLGAPQKSEMSFWRRLVR